MFGFITRTEHDRVVAQLNDALQLVEKQAGDIARLKEASRLLGLAIDGKVQRLANIRATVAELSAQLAKVHTTRGPGGRFVKREERQS